MSPSASSKAAVQVRTLDGNHAVVTNIPLRSGATILNFLGVESATPSRRSVQVAKDLHLVASDESFGEDASAPAAFQFLNHSCVPNTVVRDRSLIALHDIPAGEELTFDYNSTEWDMATPFKCWCGHVSCVGRIRGYRWLGEPARDARVEMTAPYLLEMRHATSAAAD